MGSMTHPTYRTWFQKLRRDVNLVVASRYLHSDNEGRRTWRGIGIRFYSHLITLLSSSKVTDVTSGFRAFRTQTLSNSKPLPSRHWAIHKTVDYVRSGRIYGEVPGKMRPRAHGNSQFSAVTAALYQMRVARDCIYLIIKDQRDSITGELENSDVGAGEDRFR